MLHLARVALLDAVTVVTAVTGHLESAVIAVPAGMPKRQPPSAHRPSERPVFSSIFRNNRQVFPDGSNESQRRRSVF